MITHTFRALQLLLQAIREVDNFEELERLRVTCLDLYSDDDQTSLELQRAVDRRADELTDRMTQGEIFPES
jgi:hypothetical protein